jgi:nucleoid-associated protein YgaU
MADPKSRAQRLGEEFETKKADVDARRQEAQLQAKQEEARTKLEAYQAAKAPKEVVYVIQPGDSLSKIAKEQLGDAARWTEIAELNKAEIPKPNQIRAGQEIKLPAK